MFLCVSYYSSFQLCLRWIIFKINTCCCLWSHVMGLNHTVGRWASLSLHDCSIAKQCLQRPNYVKTQCNSVFFLIKFTIFLSILILPLFGFANISCQISYINKVLLDLTSIFIKNIFAIGECCVALRSVTGASDQFETFLSHRGEEMGSIRGRVRVHVPKDKQATREKIYGGSHETGLLLTSALLALSLPTKPSSPSSVTFFDSCEFHIASSIWFLNDPWLGFTLAGIYRLLPLLAPDWLTRCILRQDRWVLCHQVRHNTHNNNSLWPNHPKQT